ncbi:hypothetical protein JXO59_16485, partial [candidate division KSB1 bacterium]|nr:hypothetical protein [candidate division KSB1 bacterium]
MLKTLCILFIAVSIASAATPVIGLLTIDATTSVESAAAWTWLQQQEGIKAELASLQNITALNPDLIFIHLASESEWTLLRSQDDAQTILVDYYKQGGKLLLTDYAALIPHWLGVESTAPVVDSVDIKDEETGRKYGFQSFRGHPLFNGFHGGVYLWHTNVDHQQARIGYFGDQWPSEGQAVGVEKAFIFLHQDDRLVIEYGPRRIISVGAFIHFSRPNYLREHTGLFLHNAINYLLHDVSGRKTTYWVNDENRARAFTIASTPPKPSKNRLLRHMPSTDLALRREPATENFYDVIGRRCIIMGKESGGIDEVWVHPFRAFYDIDVAIVQGDSLQWLRQWPCRFEARPEGIVRTYHSDTRVIREVIFAALHDHAGLIHIESDKPCKLIVRARGDLRWMWPYRQGSLGSIYYGYDDASGAFHLRDHSGDFYAILGADIQPSSHLLRACDSLLYRDNVLGGQGNLENQLLMAAVYDLNAENDYTLNIAFGAGDQGYADADRAYRSILQQPSRIYNEVVQHYENLFDNHTIVRSPDEHFNTGYLWKLVAIDRFWSTTPDLGTALLAGYGTTARGWDGGHKVNGRPGYAWYFGRDAVWSC